jgi:hypothetical protein
LSDRAMSNGAISGGMTSDATVATRSAVDWRGPLLAAAIFAVVFATLLLMAHQSESKTSDMGSSLREDPYGTSLLFDSYARAGYQVKRGEDQDSLSDQDASKTTAFFIGGYSPGDWRMYEGQFQSGTKFRERLEAFLARGGRVVLVEPRWKLKSKSQGWEIENKWDRAAQEDSLTWASPDLHAMPAGSEAMYLSGDAPWLEINAGWTVLYGGFVEDADPVGKTLRTYMAMRRVGNGELIAASQESFLLNEAIKTHPNPVLLDFLAGGRPVIWIDETLHGLRQDKGVLWLVQRYRLQIALLLFWATLLVLLWSMSGDLVRHPGHDPAVQIVRYGEVGGVAARRLLQRSITKEQVVGECWEQFRRCWPQDAEAIAADEVWGARLHAALEQSPLAGYKELCRLIAERRASAKGLARVDRDASESSTLKR